MPNQMSGQTSGFMSRPQPETFRNLPDTLIIRPLTVKLMFDNELLSGMDILVRVVCGNSIQQTKTRIEGTPNPISGEQLVFKRMNEDIIKFEVWDNSTSDFLGLGEISLSSISNLNNRVQDWVTLRSKNKETGQLLVDIQFCSDQPTESLSRSVGISTFYEQPIIQKQSRPEYVLQTGLTDYQQLPYPGEYQSHLQSGYFKGGIQQPSIQQGYSGFPSTLQSGFQKGGIQPSFQQGYSGDIRDISHQIYPQQGYHQGITQQQPLYEHGYQQSYLHHEPLGLPNQPLYQGYQSGIQQGIPQGISQGIPQGVQQGVSSYDKFRQSYSGFQPGYYSVDKYHPLPTTQNLGKLI